MNSITISLTLASAPKFFEGQGGEAKFNRCVLKGTFSITQKDQTLTYTIPVECWGSVADYARDLEEGSGVLVVGTLIEKEIPNHQYKTTGIKADQVVLYVGASTAPINFVVACGNLGRDPEAKYFESGNVKATTSIATKDRKDTHWLSLTAWGKTAEVMADYAKKGTRIGIKGQLQFDQWEKDGEVKQRLHINANSLELMGSKNQERELVGVPVGSADDDF